MKCKRCRVQVPDDVDTCPNCGQDLTSLRQLLKNFFEEDLNRPGDSSIHPPSPEDIQSLKKIDDPRFLREMRGIQDSTPPEHDGGFSLAEALSEEETDKELEQPTSLEGAQRGGFWIRYLAFTLDHLILLLTLAIFVVLGFLAVEFGRGEIRGIPSLQQAGFILFPLIPLALVLGLSYFTYFHGAWGQTIGKMIVGLKVVQVDGQPLTFSRSLVRAIAYFFSALPVFLGFFWVGFTAHKRSWHDAIAGTIVVRD